VDKFITFHQCTVICDVLWSIKRHFLLDFLCFEILEMLANLQLPLNVHKPHVFQLQGGYTPLIP